MSDAQIRALIEERDRIRQMLQSVEAELSRALGEWSREHGYGVKLSAEQALRAMKVPA